MLFFVVSVICIFFLPEVGVFSIMKQDGPTAVFVAGKIKEPVWLYILAMCLIFSAGIYFIVRKNTKSAIILVVLTVILGVMFMVRDDIRDIENKNHIEVTEKSIEEKSKEIIYLLDDGQYQLLQDEYCADMMKSYMTEEYIAEAKQYLCNDWGENVSIGNIFVQDVVQNGENVTVVQVKVSYENVGITYTIMYDEEQLIIGLYMM